MTEHFNEDKAVARLAEILALKCGIHPITARQIRIAARLHDIGKQRIDPGIVQKPGKLNEREFAIMKTHTILGAQMMSSLRGSIGEVITNTCLYHHEIWGGGGYLGKSAADVPGYVFIHISGIARRGIINVDGHSRIWYNHNIADGGNNQWIYKRY